jgi:glycerate-2-kinase
MIELPRFDDHKKHLQLISLEALEAADAHRAVREHLRLSSEGIEAGTHTIGLKPGSRIYLVACGKAAPAMTRAAVDILHYQIEAGVIAAPRHIDDLSPPFQIFHAGHPMLPSCSLKIQPPMIFCLRSSQAVDRQCSNCHFRVSNSKISVALTHFSSNPGFQSTRLTSYAERFPV